MTNVSAVVLAAGAGRRLAGVTGGVPKQFWAPGAGGTLLDDTLCRISPLVESGRTIVVVDRGHTSHVDDLRHAPDLDVVYQPCDRGTAVGVLLGLLPFHASGDDPIVVLTPSDHGVANVPMFLDTVRSAIADVHADGRRIVLFGAEPEAPTGDYGWIGLESRSSHEGSGLWPVVEFVEKPTHDRASLLMAGGAVWNTMVVVARVSTLAALYRRHLAPLTDAFDRVARASSGARPALLERVYPTLGIADFCRHLLTPADSLWARVWPVELGWTDLGTPERLRRWLCERRRVAVRAESSYTSRHARAL